MSSVQSKRASGKDLSRQQLARLNFQTEARLTIVQKEMHEVAQKLEVKETAMNKKILELKDLAGTQSKMLEAEIRATKLETRAMFERYETLKDEKKKASQELALIAKEEADRATAEANRAEEQAKIAIAAAEQSEALADAMKASSLIAQQKAEGVNALVGLVERAASSAEGRVSSAAAVAEEEIHGAAAEGVEKVARYYKQVLDEQGKAKQRKVNQALMAVSKAQAGIELEKMKKAKKMAEADRQKAVIESKADVRIELAVAHEALMQAELALAEAEGCKDKEDKAELEHKRAHVVYLDLQLLASPTSSSPPPKTAFAQPEAEKLQGHFDEAAPSTPQKHHATSVGNSSNKSKQCPPTPVSPTQVNV